MEHISVSEISLLLFMNSLLFFVTPSNQILQQYYRNPMRQNQMYQKFLHQQRGDIPYFYKNFYVHPNYRPTFNTYFRQGSIPAQPFTPSTTIDSGNDKGYLPRPPIKGPTIDPTVGPSVKPTAGLITIHPTVGLTKDPKDDPTRNVTDDPTKQQPDYVNASNIKTTTEQSEEYVDKVLELKYKEGIGYPKQYPYDVINDTSNDKDTKKFDECSDLLFLCKRTERKIPVCVMKSNGQKVMFSNFCQVSYINCMHDQDQWVYLRDYNCSEITSNADYDTNNVNVPVAVNPLAAEIPNVDWDVQYDDPFYERHTRPGDSSQERLASKIEEEMEAHSHKNENENIRNETNANVVQNGTENYVKPNAGDDVKSNTENVVEPTTENVVEPTTENVVKPNTENVVKPNTENVVKPNTKNVAKKNTENYEKPNKKNYVKPNIKIDEKPNTENDVKPNTNIDKKPNSENDVIRNTENDKKIDTEIKNEAKNKFSFRVDSGYESSDEISEEVANIVYKKS